MWDILTGTQNWYDLIILDQPRNLNLYGIDKNLNEIAPGQLNLCLFHISDLQIAKTIKSLEYIYRYIYVCKILGKCIKHICELIYLIVFIPLTNHVSCSTDGLPLSSHILPTPWGSPTSRKALGDAAHGNALKAWLGHLLWELERYVEQFGQERSRMMSWILYSRWQFEQKRFHVFIYSMLALVNQKLPDRSRFLIADWIPVFVAECAS